MRQDTTQQVRQATPQQVRQATPQQVRQATAQQYQVRQSTPRTATRPPAPRQAATPPARAQTRPPPSQLTELPPHLRSKVILVRQLLHCTVCLGELPLPAGGQRGWRCKSVPGGGPALQPGPGGLGRAPTLLPHQAGRVVAVVSALLHLPSSGYC